ncbi:putative RNA methyltransferase [Lentibacillus sp. L22]|uniref:putative RNA methyltransferase n=1 Tax=Lentibacillus TaxID=175304 RepID=UPI0022B0BDB5|nr:methyltransferase domain-containing protein [Lentibacillus daqui]
MTNKEKNAEMVSQFVEVFRCPLCKGSMKVVDLKSLMCSNNHTFDFAKQGYINMLNHPSSNQYNKNLFAARHQIIMNSNLYSLLHERISKVIIEYVAVSNEPFMILDAGCGEGSHLQRVLDECKDEAIIGVGLDISKEGIKMAAREYQKSIWLVGDLANSPLANQSCHAIINILSPANYTDFKRILASDGLIVKVVPRANYLIELRETLFNDTAKMLYKNDQTVSLFKKHFHLVNKFKLSYTKVLNQTELIHLAQMSPLAWNAKKEQFDTFFNQGSSEITVDLDILVGMNK